MATLEHCHYKQPLCLYLHPLCGCSRRHYVFGLFALLCVHACAGRGIHQLVYHQPVVTSRLCMWLCMHMLFILPAILPLLWPAFAKVTNLTMQLSNLSLPMLILWIPALSADLPHLAEGRSKRLAFLIEEHYSSLYTMFSKSSTTGLMFAFLCNIMEHKFVSVFKRLFSNQISIM